MRIRVLPTTAGRCLIVIDRTDVSAFAPQALRDITARDGASVDGVIVTDEDVDLPALATEE